MTDEAFLTVKDVADRLKVPPSWIYDRVRGQLDPLPHYKIGKYVRFKWSEVAAWVGRQRRGGYRSCPGASGAPVPVSQAKQ